MDFRIARMDPSRQGGIIEICRMCLLIHIKEKYVMLVGKYMGKQQQKTNKGQ